MGRVFVIIGMLLVAIGLLWPWVSRLGLGHLPGDIRVRGAHGAFYFPITTCVVISLALSLLWWFFHR